MSEADDLLLRFLERVEGQGLKLYPAQEEAVLALYEEQNVILNTPTGSGKSLVAAALHFKALGQGLRSVYTCPIKALVNEKWMALCKEFGPENVGLSTGDATLNRDAPILCCTAEILANLALQHGANTPFADVVMDEFHYYSDSDRGVAWQVPLLEMAKSRFLLLSATLGDTAFFEEALTGLNGRPTVTVRAGERPVPLEYEYAETPLARTVEGILEANRGPVYVVHFTQREAADRAQDFTSLQVATRDEKAAIAKELEGVRFNSPYGAEFKRLLRHGIGLHHAGLLPRYRVLVERLAQRGLLKVVCGTDTLGVGVNVPIRTVLFTQLFKFNGQKTAILTARDFHQIGGRAGRKGFDDRGWVVAQAPAHAIENLVLEKKQAEGGKKFVKRKPPEKNFVNWDQNTFQRLIGAPPERLTSQFRVGHGMLLHVLSRPGDGCAAMRSLLRRCHEPPKSRRTLIRRSWQLFRALWERGIVQPGVPGSGSKLCLNVELQDAFSMDQTLSLYLVDTLSALDPAAEGYEWVLLSLVEAIVEDPDLILRRQLDRVKTEALAEMKQDGLDYEARMEELEKLEYPKPEREFIYSTFNAFADRHPWVGQENIRPKSVVREMFERYLSFSDYVHIYELQRAEGLLLRHISAVYKVLKKTVPESARTEPVREMELYLRTVIRQIDSSLLEEWEKMRNPSYVAVVEAEVRPEAPADLTRDRARFVAEIRQVIFGCLRGILAGDWERAAELFQDGSDAVQRLRVEFEKYEAARGRYRLDPEARNLRHTRVLEAEEVPGGAQGCWRIEQTLVDQEGENDWVAEFEADLGASREQNSAVLRFLRIRPMFEG